MNAPMNNHGNFHHRHNAGFWPASTLRVVCLDNDDMDTLDTTNLQMLFSSDSFSLASSTSNRGDGESIRHDLLLQPFELDGTSSHPNVYTTSPSVHNKTRVPALITILSSLDTPTKSNTTKTHKRNEKMRGVSFFGNDDALDESPPIIPKSKRGFMPSSSPFHPLFPRQVHDTDKDEKVAIGVLPAPNDDS